MTFPLFGAPVVGGVPGLAAGSAAVAMGAMGLVLLALTVFIIVVATWRETL